MRKLLFTLSALLLGLLLYPTIREIALICWNSEDYSHGLILPLVSAYLLWTDREKLFANWSASRPPERLSAGAMIAFGLLMLGALLLCAGSITQILFISWFAVFPLVIGALALSLGWRATQPLIAPILLLFMAKPIPDSVVPLLFFPLQVTAARVSAQVLEMLSVPVFLAGNIIEIPGMRLMVEEACSGIRSLMALLTVACIVSLIVPMRLWARLMIIAVSVITAIALNVFRVALTGVLAHFYDPESATGFFHEFSGLVVFGIGLVIVYGLANLVSGKLPAQSGEKHVPLAPVLSSRGVSLCAFGLILAVSGQQFLDMRLARSGGSNVQVEQFPATIDGWVGSDGQKMELSSREKLRLDGYVKRFYRKANEKAAFVYLGYWAQQSGEHQAAKHSPMMCLPANGWKVTKLKPVTATLLNGEKIPVSRVIGQYDQHFTLVYYFFFNGTQYYVREWEALIRIAVSAILGRRTDGGIVEISHELTPEEARVLQQNGHLEGTDRFLEPAVLALDTLLSQIERKK